MSQLVPATPTPWAAPYDHNQICVQMDGILYESGIVDAHVRRRLTAHAIVASGWRQSCQCYNAWKVKRGGWTGPVYEQDTIEVVDGQEVPESGTLWRAYESYDAAIADHPVFTMSRYAKAKAALLDASRADGDYWVELGKAGYYTAEPDGAWFESICNRVAKELTAGAAVTAETTASKPASMGAAGIAIAAVFAAAGLFFILGGIVLVSGKRR